MDIKAAFLQGRDITRNVYVKPPLEANCDKNTLWKLNKSVYGLKDASREWYLTIKTLLMNQGCKQLLTDPSAFCYYENDVLSGVFLMHVDDFFYGEVQNTLKNMSLKRLEINFKLVNNHLVHSNILVWS